MSMMFAPPAPRLYQPESFRAILRGAELTGEETLEDFIQATIAEQEQRSKRHRLPDLAPCDPPENEADTVFGRFMKKLVCCL